MPMSALGAIVIYTGYKLCAPKVWKHVAHIGSEQLFVFATTVLVTVSTDLLWGIAAGIVAKLLLEASIVSQGGEGRPRRAAARVGPSIGAWLGRTGELFRNPVVQTRRGRRRLPPLLRAAAGLLQLHAPRRGAGRDPQPAARPSTCTSPTW